jgi:hypothetical protein
MRAIPGRERGRVRPARSVRRLKRPVKLPAMKLEELSAYAAVVQAVLALFTLGVSVAISIILYRWSNRVDKSEHDRSTREWWNNLNQTALSSDEMLLVADELMNPSAAKHSVEEKRRRWFAFLVLNVLSSSYLGVRDGLSRSADDTVKIVKHHLRILLRADDIYELSQQGYEADFAALCREVRGELSAERSERLQSASPPSTKIV